RGFWINPENGKKNEIGILEGKDILTIKPEERKNSNDWILLLVEEK
ncbi:MAG: hypothetical protein K2F56_05030, partial [Anaeroplasmataceae bacterium]|nr:hypothetical protein [Anaeroplasmataceae bacterium]